MALLVYAGLLSHTPPGNPHLLLPFIFFRAGFFWLVVCLVFVDVRPLYRIPQSLSLLLPLVNSTLRLCSCALMGSPTISQPLFDFLRSSFLSTQCPQATARLWRLFSCTKSLILKIDLSQNSPLSTSHRHVWMDSLSH